MLQGTPTMSFIVKNNRFEKAPLIDEGSYASRIYSIIQIGTVKNYLGQDKNVCRITFELPTETMEFKAGEGAKPRVISTSDISIQSLHEKSTLRKIINACDPKGIVEDSLGQEEYDISNLIGKTCLLTISHEKSQKDNSVYAKISNWSPLPKGMKCDDAVNDPKVLMYHEWNQEVFDSLPDFLKDKMRASLEYKKMTNQVDDSSIYEDLNAVPF